MSTSLLLNVAAHLLQRSTVLDAGSFLGEKGSEISTYITGDSDQSKIQKFGSTVPTMRTPLATSQSNYGVYMHLKRIIWLSRMSALLRF